MTRKDNFSIQSDLYARYRPHYPAELYSYLFSKTARFDVAWDCGTGNGQVAVKLARHFKKVLATDISKKQLINAQKAKNIDYILAPAEQTPIPAQSIDLITVAQAIHWFEPELFYREAKRVSKSGATLAYWGYSLPHISKTIDPVIRDFHDNVVGPYWDTERKNLLCEYADINFPLANPEQKNFTYTVQWDLDHLSGYLNSWSSVQHYIKAEGKNPVEKHLKAIKDKWIDNQKVTFPVFLTLGRII